VPITGCSPFHEKKMKKLFLFAVLSLSLLTIVSCSDKKSLKQTKGVVTDLKTVKDSLVTAKVAVDGDTLLFKLADARFVNGMFIKDDSVQIDYIDGRGDTLRALVINVLPKAVQYIDLNSAPSDTLVTRTMEQEDSLQ